MTLDRIPQHDGTRHPGDVDGKPAELGPHPLLDEGYLVARSVRIREEEPQQPLLDELARCPDEGAHALLAASRVGYDHIARSWSGRRPEGDRREGTRFDLELQPPSRRLVVEEPIVLVEPQQILALHVEHEDAQVGGALTQNVGATGEQAKEEQGERRLRCDPRDA